MTELFHFGREELTFGDLEGNACKRQACEHIVKMVDMFLDRVREDNDVFQVDEACLPLELSQNEST